MRPTIAVVQTGGTIGQRTTSAGSVLDGAEASDLVERCRPDGIDLRRIVGMERNSPDVSPQDWSALAGLIADALANGADGIVVLHGTDTMAYTAAALSFALVGVDRPVVITGSMMPGGDPDSDAPANLTSAYLVATSALPGVNVVFGSDVPRVKAEVLPGTRLIKTRTADAAAFSAAGPGRVGRVLGSRLELVTPPPTPSSWSPPEQPVSFAAAVDLVKVTPLTTPARLRMMLDGLSGVVIEGYGAGHVPADHIAVLRDFSGPVVMSTQVQGDAERLGSYASDRALTELPQLIGGGTMTSVVALVKLSWVLGQGLPVHGTMNRNVAGEF